MAHRSGECSVQAVIGYRTWNVIRNVGDAILPYLIEMFTGAQPHFSPNTIRHLIGVGSIMSMANDKSVIWGTGILVPHAFLPKLDAGQFHAVRGKMTADLLAKAGVKLGDIPFGDPGIFADEILLNESLAGPPLRHKIVVLPHHASFGHPLFQRLANSNEVCVVNTCDNTLLPLQQILHAEVVVSQSLHGLIFAESLGKPAIWISDDDEYSLFKYYDWQTTIDNKRPVAASLNTPFDDLVAMAERQYNNIDKAALRQAFPKRELIGDVVKPLVQFRTCRQYSPFVFFIDGEAESSDAGMEQPGQDGVQKFYSQVKSATAALFENWAERPYVLAILRNKGVMPTPKQLEVIVQKMDQVHTIDLGILVHKSEIQVGTKIEEELRSGVTRFGVPADLPVSAMLVRPLYDWHPRSIAVFGL